jgi:hypothetical protein
VAAWKEEEARGAGAVGGRFGRHVGCGAGAREGAACAAAAGVGGGGAGRGVRVRVVAGAEGGAGRAVHAQERLAGALAGTWAVRGSGEARGRAERGGPAGTEQGGPRGRSEAGRGDGARRPGGLTGLSQAGRGGARRVWETERGESRERSKAAAKAAIQAISRPRAAVTKHTPRAICALQSPFPSALTGPRRAAALCVAAGASHSRDEMKVYIF